MRRVPGPAGPPHPAGRCSPLHGAVAGRARTHLPSRCRPASRYRTGRCWRRSAAPEPPGPPDPDRAAVGKAVEEGPQPRLAGAEDRQFHPGLRVQGRVVAVAGPEGHIAPGEQRVNDLVLSASLAAGPTPPRRVIVIWPPNTWQKAMARSVLPGKNR